MRIIPLLSIPLILRGQRIGYDDHLSADDLFRSEMEGNAGDDGTLLVPEVDFQSQQFVGLFHFYGGQDGPNPKVQLCKILVDDRGF